jgi:hypothetical protein
MSAPINTGGPAFPQLGTQFNHDYGEREAVTVDPGMSLRDYAAIKAMTTLLAGSHASSEGQFPELAAVVARLSFVMADAMLVEREKGGAA